MVTNITMDQLENNKFIEGPGYPKSTVRNAIMLNGEAVSTSNRFPIDGIVVSSDAQLTNSPISKSVTVSTTAVRLDSTPLSERRTVVVANTSDEDVIYLGNASVVASEGFPLDPKEKQAFDLIEGAGIFGISDSVSIDIRVMELK